MGGFLLSPGITAWLTDTALTVYVLLLAGGAVAAGRRGFAVGFAFATVIVSVVKLYTDWADTYDDAVAFTAIAVAVVWATELFLTPRFRERFWPAAALLGIVGLYVGWIKFYTDYYDPFDLLSALSAMVAGAALLIEPVRDRLPGRSRSLPLAGLPGAAAEPPPPRG